MQTHSVESTLETQRYFLLRCAREKTKKTSPSSPSTRMLLIDEWWWWAEAHSSVLHATAQKQCIACLVNSKALRSHVEEYRQYSIESKRTAKLLRARTLGRVHNEDRVLFYLGSEFLRRCKCNWFFWWCHTDACPSCIHPNVDTCSRLLYTLVCVSAQ